MAEPWTEAIVKKLRYKAEYGRGKAGRKRIEIGHTIPKPLMVLFQRH